MTLNKTKIFPFLLVAVASLLFLPLSSEAPAAPKDFYGIVAEDVTSSGDGAMLSEMGRIKDHGVGIIRQTFDWSQIEPSKGQFNFGTTDQIVGNAADRGLRILPILFNTPSWALPSSTPKKGTYPPKRAEDMADFARVLVARYGKNGSFWQNGHDGGYAIKTWQIWNEPNLPVYWPKGPKASEYVALLKPAYKAIKATDSSAKVVAAGLPNSKLGTPFKVYVKSLYKAGGKRYFDVLAVNAYAATDRGVLEAVKTTRKIMRSNRDRAKIWVTEIGWATNAPGKSQFETSASGQAKRISKTLRGLCKKRSALGVYGVIYFSWRDGKPYSKKDWWGLHTGLIKLDGSDKPALKAYRNASKC